MSSFFPFPSKQTDPKTGEPEGLSFEFDLCEAVATWEQVRIAVIRIFVYSVCELDWFT